MRTLLVLALALAAFPAAGQSSAALPAAALTGRWVLERVTHTMAVSADAEAFVASYPLTLEIVELAFAADGRAEGVLLVAQPDGLERVTLGADWRLDDARIVFDLDPDPDDVPAGHALRVAFDAALDDAALMLSDEEGTVAMRFVRVNR